MVNDHLSADEVVECEKLVQEIAAIVRGERQSDQLSVQDVDGHVITLRYGNITVHVYPDKVGIQGDGSGPKNYADELIWRLLQEDSVRDELLQKGSEEWLRRLRGAWPS